MCALALKVHTFAHLNNSVIYLKDVKEFADLPTFMLPPYHLLRERSGCY